MKALLVDDNTAPFAVEPSNGTTAIQCIPGDAPGGDGGLLAVRLFTNSGLVPFNAGDSVDLFDVSPVCSGNALRISWNAIATMILGAGSTPGFNFTLVVDGVEVAELDDSVGYFAAGAPANSTMSSSRSFWVLGVAPGTHEVVLNASFAGATLATGNIAANSSLVVEDWKLGGGTQSSGSGGNVEFAQVTLSIPNLGPNEFNNQNSVDTTGLFSTPVQPGDFLWCNCLYLIASGTSTFAAAIECTAQDTCAIAVVAFNSGSPAADMVVRIGRVAAP